MKILMTILGSFGHATPFIEVGKSLKEQGHEVIFAINNELIHLFDDYDFKVHCYMPIFIPGMKLDTYSEVVESVVPRLWRDCMDYFDELNSVMDGVSLVIRDPNCSVGFLVAEYNNVPCVDLLLSPQCFSSDFKLPTTHSPLGLDKTNELRKKLGLAEKETVPYFVFSEDNLKIVAYPKFFVESMRSSAPEFFEHSNLRFTNFPTLFQETNLNNEIEEFLQSGEPPVMFAMGSGSDTTEPENFWKIAYELGKNVRRSILQTNQGNFPSHENVLFVSNKFVPHHKLFPRCSLVVNHGGMGTIGKCLYADVPQISIPQMGENELCASLMSDMMVSILPQDVTYDTLAKLIENPRHNQILAKERGDYIRNHDGVKMIIDILKEYKYLNE